MKKIIAAAAGLMLAGTMVSSASAVESQFGGYWRTRAFTQIDFDGKDSGTYSRTDTRTRLYYTAVFNENFKFVNKFEFNSVFGDSDGGDIGADGENFRVKNSYADFTTGMARFKVGTFGSTIARGFMFADDHSGIYAGLNAGDMALLQFLWVKAQEEEATSKGSETIEDGWGPGVDLVLETAEEQVEVDYYAFLPVLNVSDSLSVNPHLTYAATEGTDDDIWWLGVDVDFSTDAMSVWGTAIYNGGEINDGVDDVEAWLLAAGGSVGMFHGQAFYATGDDTAGDGDAEAFVSPSGSSYYWSEIMGYGIFDNQESAGSPEDNITNIMAANVGVTTKVSEKLTLTGDLWYAAHAEDVNGEDELGVEVDLKATYAIYDNLNLDLVAAYLFAGDATSNDGSNEEDPIEVGARLSLAF